MNVTTQPGKLVMTAPHISPNPGFPTLRILPIDRIFTHERFDPSRKGSLQERLKADGILRNPPIVTPMDGPEEAYVVLDGANRTYALKAMGVPHVLVQIVGQNCEGLELSTWKQVVLGIRPPDLIYLLREIPVIDLRMGLLKQNFQTGSGSSNIIQVILSTDERYHAVVQQIDLPRKVHILNSVMDKIKEFARIDRTHLNDMETLKDFHPDLAGLIQFPEFTLQEILRLTMDGQMVPAGITRFTISPRALRVNYKISELMSVKETLTEKNERLMSWIQNCVAHKGVRSYNETTVMFDE